MTVLPGLKTDLQFPTAYQALLLTLCPSSVYKRTQGKEDIYMNISGERERDIIFGLPSELLIEKTNSWQNSWLAAN